MPGHGERSAPPQPQEGLLSRQDYEQAVAQARTAEANARAAEADIQSQQVQLLDVQVDREKARALGVPTGFDSYSTLSVYLGSQYVNDFTFASRVYRVYVQAAVPFPHEPKDISSFSCALGAGGDGAAGGAGEGDARDERGEHPALQPLPLRDDQRPAGARREHGRCARRPWSRWHNRACPRASPSSGRGARAQKEAGGKVLLIFGLGIVAAAR